MSDEGFHGGDLMVLNLETGQARNLSPGRKASPNWMAWRSATSLIFTEYAGGGSAIAAADLGTGAIERLWQGEEAIRSGGYGSNFALAADGRMSAAVRESFDTPPELWAGPVGRWQRVTHGNEGLKPLWGRAESLTWTLEGHTVQGWLIHPSEERPGRKYPMVVEIHGGPSGLVTPEWDASLPEALSTDGYFVLMPNPRGSYGQGEAFTQANIKDFGGGDLRDILAGVDKVLATCPVDSKR